MNNKKFKKNDFVITNDNRKLMYWQQVNLDEHCLVNRDGSSIYENVVATGETARYFNIGEFDADVND
jgi:hypothetical protein